MAMGNGEFGTWAEFEFGSAQLGDSRRLSRLVRCAAGAAERPSGKLTAVFDVPAEREAAYRLVENSAVASDEVGAAAHRACAARAAEFPFVFVPTDGSSLNLTDTKLAKRLGVVGTRAQGAQGLVVMSAIAVSPDGVPLGVCGQVFWTRPERSPHRKHKHDKRRPEEKETRYWLDVMAKTRAAFDALAPDTKPWFQLDRGGDAWPVLLAGLQPGQLFTVRASYDRRLWTEDPNTERTYLRQALVEAPVLGRYELEVLGGPNRKARHATMEVHVAAVTLRIEDERTKEKRPLELYAVLTSEVSEVPPSEQPLQWLLLTSKPVLSMRDAEQVIEGYAQRWRIEEFHRIWKSGACNVEEAQLGDRDHFVRWATILASVAMRILRLTYLGRHQPQLPATVELSEHEIKAVLLLRRPKRKGTGGPTIGEVSTWLAELGGYTGKSSGGPPGAIVIGRGLERIDSVVQVLMSGAKM